MDGLRRDLADALERVRRYAEGQHAEVALLAGSHVHGTASLVSDHDVVLLFSKVPSAWREMVRFDDADLEVFAHDLGTVAYFCDEIERPSGESALARMILEGEPALLANPDLLRGARAIAQATLARGPIPWDEATRDRHRYAITDLAESLRVGGTRRIAIGSALHAALAGFVLRANGQWSASGKAAPAALAAFRPGLDTRFASAFEALFIRDDAAAVQSLVDELLSPFAGRLRAGFRQAAPASWRK
jgi:hypothetical protein